MDNYKTKWFNKWINKVGVSNNQLVDAISDLKSGLSVSSLGGNLFKVRVKKLGTGKSSGFRTIVVYKEGDKVIFLYGFKKNEKQNISQKELKYFKILAKDLLELTSLQIEQSIEQNILFKLEELTE